MNLNHLSLPTICLERSIAFYRSLQLRLVVHSPPRYARLECPDGESTLSLHLVETLPQGESAVVYFECSNLDATVDHLASIGVSFLHGPRDECWLWREARLSDPSGNVICLYWAGGNRKDPPWRVSSGHCN